MQIDGKDYLCGGFGIGGLNPSSDAFCHDLYKKKEKSNV